MMSFSERLGITQPKEIQIANLDMELRISLWNVCHTFCFSANKRRLLEDDMYELAYALYKNFYKLPVDKLPLSSSEFVSQQRNIFENGLWYRVLEIVEFLRNLSRSGSIEQRNFEHQINEVLEREKSAYRFIAGKLTSITNEIEMQELEQAARHGDRFASVAEHVRTALDLYSKKPQADYRNTIKESISAVESAAKIITGLPNATLDQAIKAIDQRHSLHASFKKGIFNYTATPAMKAEFDTA